MAISEGADALIVQQALTAGIAWTSVGASGAAAFNTGWSNQGAPYQVVQYGIDATGRINLRGMAKQTTSALTVFTLPAGYRPAATEVFTCGFGNGYVNVVISATGVVSIAQLAGGALTGLQVPFTGISFDSAAAASSVLPNSATAPKVYAVTGTTNSSGQVTFDIPNGTFSSLSSVNATPVRNTASAAQFCAAFVLSQSTSQVVVQVAESKSTGIIIGGNVEGLEASPAGITVNLLMTGS